MLDPADLVRSPMIERPVPAMAETVAEVLGETGPLGAYELSRLVALRRPTPTYCNSVYRTLAALRDSGDVLHIATTKRFVLRDPALDQPMLLLCERCGLVSQAEGRTVVDDLQQTASTNAFRVAAFHIEISGTCRTCDQSL